MPRPSQQDTPEPPDYEPEEMQLSSEELANLVVDRATSVWRQIPHAALTGFFTCLFVGILLGGIGVPASVGAGIGIVVGLVVFVLWLVWTWRGGVR